MARMDLAFLALLALTSGTSALSNNNGLALLPVLGVLCL